MPDLTAQEVTDVVSRFGFKGVDPRGICAGLEMMGINAFLSDDFGQDVEFEKFKKRFEVIADFVKYPKYFEKIEKKTADQKLQTEYFELSAFFSQLHIYHKPHQYDELFEERLVQTNVAKISPVAQSALLEKKQGLADVDISVGGYSEKDLENFLQVLRKHLLANKQNIALSLGGEDHAISVCYDFKKDKWILIDSVKLNRYGTNFIMEYDAGVSNMSKLMAQLIYQTLELEGQKNQDVLLLSIRSLTTGENRKAVEEIFVKLREDPAYIQPNILTSEKLNKIGANNFIRFAAMEDCPHVINELHRLSHQFDLEALKLASDWNAPHVIDALAKTGFDINQVIIPQTGETLAHIAAQLGRIDILRVLDTQEKNLNVKDKYSTKPIALAKNSHREKAVLFLESVDARNALLEKVNKLPEEKRKDMKEKIQASWREADKANDHRAFIKNVSLLEKEMKALSPSQPIAKKIFGFFQEKVFSTKGDSRSPSPPKKR